MGTFQANRMCTFDPERIPPSLELAIEEFKARMTEAKEKIAGGKADSRDIQEDVSKACWAM